MLAILPKTLKTFEYKVLTKQLLQDNKKCRYISARFIRKIFILLLSSISSLHSLLHKNIFTTDCKRQKWHFIFDLNFPQNKSHRVLHPCFKKIPVHPYQHTVHTNFKILVFKFSYWKQRNLPNSLVNLSRCVRVSNGRYNCCCHIAYVYRLLYSTVSIFPQRKESHLMTPSVCVIPASVKWSKTFNDKAYYFNLLHF